MHHSPSPSSIVGRRTRADPPTYSAVFNANNPFIMKSFLDVDPKKDLAPGLDLNVYGAVHFAQAVIPLLLAGGGGSLIFSGATAALRGGNKLSAFSPSKFALRSLSQSLAREFGPQGVHVAHTILDGLIDTPAMHKRFGKGEEGKVSFKGCEECARTDLGVRQRLTPESIAAAYVYLAQQPKDCWTQELDMRPYSETW